jgi:hypothetical protein
MFVRSPGIALALLALTLIAVPPVHAQGGGNIVIYGTRINLAGLGETVSCQYSYVQNFTDAQGIARFAVRGSRIPGAAHAPNKVKVYADSYLAGTLSAGTYDLDGANGISLADLGLWATDYFNGTNPDRCDYNGTNGVTLADLALFSAAYFSNCSSASGPTTCP